MSEKTANHREEFSNWWKGQWKDVKYPVEGSVFDYYMEEEMSAVDGSKSMKIKHWSEKVSTFTYLPEQVFGSIMVPTVQVSTVCLSQLLSALN